MTVASRSSDPEESDFRLLAPPSNTVSSETALIDVAGQRWQVVNHGAVPFPDCAPEYTCVSYSWGGGRAPNPFDPERPISPRTLPALETAIAALRPPAIWLDAACLPTQEPARKRCLRSMGAIYAAASGVLAVLSPSASVLLDKVRREEAVGSDELRLLEADDWVNRVCEQKGDLSFIYSSAPRASGDAGGWRPRPGPLPPIVPWPSVGELKVTHAETEKVWRVTDAAKDRLTTSLQELITTLEARIHELEAQQENKPAEKPLGTRERDTLLKIIIGTALECYKYDPSLSRSAIPQEIADDLAKQGIAVDVDTVRKWLKQAAEFLPG